MIFFMLLVIIYGVIMMNVLQTDKEDVVKIGVAGFIYLFVFAVFKFIIEEEGVVFFYSTASMACLFWTYQYKTGEVGQGTAVALGLLTVFICLLVTFFAYAGK